jgi:hypothetical protein
MGPFEPSPRFYVETSPNPPTPTNNQQDDLVVNLEDSNLELDDLIIPNQTQGVIELGDLLSLPRLPTRRRHGKEPLVDYSSLHVVTLDQYLVVLRQKALEKKVDKIKEHKSKEREENISIWVEHTLTPTYNSLEEC